MSNTPPSKNKILGMLAMSHFSQHLWIGVAALYPYIRADLGLSYTEIGAARGIASIVSGFLQIVYSIIARYVPRRFLLAAGNTLYSIASLIISIATGFYHLAVANLLGGIGAAAQHPVSVSIIGDRFEKVELSGALGVFYGLGYMGNIIGPLILTQIAIHWSWRNSLLVLSVLPISIGCGLILLLKGADQPTLKGKEKGSSSLLADAKTALRNKSARMTIAAQAFLSGGTGQGVIVTYTALFLKDGLGLGDTMTSVLYSITMAGGVLGTLLISRFANRLGPLRTCIVSATIASLGVLALSFQESFSYLLIPNLLLVGLFAFPTSNLMQSHISSVSEPSERDLLIGLYFTVGFGLSSVWATLIGFTIDIFGSFRPAWTLMAGLAGVAILLQLWAYRLSK
ncbi:MAG: MFS transporter [Candidatus Bathyarchaeota archaeon]|nr:MAG: MFS transporter [Candidatus Bathyarchaeota archaeon]